MNKKLSRDDVLEIKKLIEEECTALKIAEKYNVAPNTISDIKMKRTWVYVTRHSGRENNSQVQ